MSIEEKLKHYYETATPEKVVNELEKLEVEFIRKPEITYDRVNEKYRINNIQNSFNIISLSRGELILLYIEIHKLL